ncbi:unnamed protein product [Schistosoma spindalis]|nr:unnamed protein product [Schistosoma spindale]
MTNYKLNESRVCKFCEGYYDFGSEQPVCSSCHAFIYEFSLPQMTENRLFEEKEASNDSGNEEPDKGSDLFSAAWNSSTSEVTSQNHVLVKSRPSCARIFPATCPLQQSHVITSYANYPVIDYLSPVSSRKIKSCSSCMSPSLEDLPTEILLRVFLMVDDICLWSLRQASPRCRAVIDSEISEQQWESYVSFRWPLFNPNCRVESWRLLYLNMMESVTCRFCLERLRLPVVFPIEAPKVRYKRIKHEFENLCADPPYGIKIITLDTATYSHFLAGIEGPPQSPYQGGFFHVLILVPDSYPFRPPVIRFLTRILHPNISFHGDVGLDSIRHNWCLALSLEKLLISILALLTDPHTRVCMEPVIGALYDWDKYQFEELAKLWTWKFACHDYLSADFVSAMVLPDYIEQTHQRLNCKQIR